MTWGVFFALVLTHLLAAVGGFLFAWFGINVAARLVVPLMSLEHLTPQRTPTTRAARAARQEQIFEEMWGPILPRTFRAVSPEDQRRVQRQEGPEE